MPDDPTPSPAADTGVSLPAAPVSQPAPSGIPSEWLSAWSSPIDTAPTANAESAGVSNGEIPPPEAAAPASASDAKPAPDTGVKASDAPGPDSESDTPTTETPEKALSRREQERATHVARISELEARLGEATSPTYREQLRTEILAEEAQRATAHQTVEQTRIEADRFEQACRMSDADPRLNDVVPGTDQTLYQWREDRKDLIARYPEAEAAIRAEAERRIAQATEQANHVVAAGWEQIRGDIVAQIAASEGLPHVDKAAFQQAGVTWREMAEQIHAAGAAWKEADLAERVTKAEAEAARLTQENAALRAGALDDRRVPATIGRSAGAAPDRDVFDPELSWRENLIGAFTPNGSS